MRWSGLAIRDALTIERAEIRHTKGVYSVTTARQKTGTHVSVPIPPDVAREVLAVPNDNPRYVFWSGNGAEESITKNWAKYYVAPVFKAAGIPQEGHMMSHRLRDTFAVDLLEKGVPLEEVSKLLGHESIKTTERHYAKWVKGRQDRLNALVVGTWAK
jgi:integrase